MFVETVLMGIYELSHANCYAVQETVEDMMSIWSHLQWSMMSGVNSILTRCGVIAAKGLHRRVAINI